jgi:ATP-binding cassette, subfamily B, bacterial
VTRQAQLVDDVLWPAARLGEALRTLARHGEAAGTDGDVAVPPDDLSPDELGTWMAAAAAREGMEADRAFCAVGDLSDLLEQDPPLILQMAAPGVSRGFLCVVRGGRRSIRVIDPNLRVRRLDVDAVRRGLQKDIGQPVDGIVDRALAGVGLESGDEQRVRAALIDDHLSRIVIRNCWLLHLPQAAGLRAAAREAGLPRQILLLTVAHAAQAVLFVASWWLLGRGLLDGTIDRGWLFGWVLLLLSLIPFRLLTSWTQGAAAVRAGAALRQRLLRGALRMNGQDVREQGAGAFYSLVAECGAVESLALGGGLLALLASMELVLAAVVLWIGAGWLPAAGLALWAAATCWVTARYVSRRRLWTGERLSITHQLLEAMIGHRTRLVQQEQEDWHRQEDYGLDRYATAGARMDEWDLRLLVLAPRGWLALAMVTLAPLAAGGLSSGRLAAAIGGMLLAYRAFRRLTTGLSDVSGAAIATRLVMPLARAAATREPPGSPAVVLPRTVDGASGPIADARDLVFRHRGATRAVLDGCTLQVPRGARLLLEGPSGSGKTTLASVIAGLHRAASGLLLVGGLDRTVLGAAGWRARVVMAPQAHDNHVLSGSLAFNLLLGGRWPAGEHDLREAEQICRELGLGDLLERMPGGLHETVGETGWQLSQGEQARVFLARALLQRPELLVLDETFSALDPENVERAIRCVQQRASAILAIAHP